MTDNSNLRVKKLRWFEIVVAWVLLAITLVVPGYGIAAGVVGAAMTWRRNRAFRWAFIVLTVLNLFIRFVVMQK